MPIMAECRPDMMETNRLILRLAACPARSEPWPLPAWLKEACAATGKAQSVTRTAPATWSRQLRRALAAPFQDRHPAPQLWCAGTLSFQLRAAEAGPEACCSEGLRVGHLVQEARSPGSGRGGQRPFCCSTGSLRDLSQVAVAGLPLMQRLGSISRQAPS